MQRFFTVLFLFLIFKVSAQTSAPKLINYQGVARDAGGAPIIAPFDIRFIIKDLTQVVHDETQNNIQPSTLGLFTTKIGISPTFTYTGWGGSNLQLEIWIKAGATFTQIGTQQLVSVPFSLFANDVPSSYNSNVLTIGANSYNISSGSATTPTINGTGLVTVTPNTGPVYSVGVPTPSLSYASAGNILTLTQGPFSTSVPITGAGNSTVSMYGAGLASVSPTSGSSFTVNVPPPALNFSANTLIYSQGTFVTSSTPFNPTVSGDVFGPISTTTVTALRNIPIANVAPFTNQVLTYNGSAWTPSVLAAAPLGWSLMGNSGTSAAVNYIGTSDAVDLSIRTSGSTKMTVKSGGNVGVGTSSPNYKLDVLEIATPSAAVTGKNLSGISNSQAIGVYGETNSPDINASGVSGNNVGNGIGVYGKTNSTNSNVSGVLGENTSVGPSVRGVKNSTVTIGNAGKFELQSSSNNNDAVFAITQGTGAAVHAATGTATTSALSLLLDNGHIKAVQSASAIIGKGASVANATIGGSGPTTDVAGEISFNTGSPISGTSPFEVAKVTFARAYDNIPSVVVSPRNGTASSYSFFVVPSASGFSIFFVGSPPTLSNFQYTYIVIGH